MAFPPGRTLILPKTYWYSRGLTPTLTLGSAFDLVQYPLTNLTDASNGPVFKFATTAAGVEVAVFGAPINIVGVLNHNLDPDVLIELYIDGVLQPKTFSVRYPNCWIDLRAFEPGFPDVGLIPSSSVGIKMYGNSRPVNFSELVVGRGEAFEGLIETPFLQGLTTPTQRHWTDSRRKLMEWGSGVHTRAMRLTLPLVSPADYATLQAITEASSDSARMTRVVVVPSTRQNDIWIVNWPAAMPAVKTIGGVSAIQLDLIEDSGGVVV